MSNPIKSEDQSALSIFNTEEKKYKCGKCFDTGRFTPPGSHKSIPCPECKSLKVTMESITYIEIDDRKMSKLLIPEKFQGQAFSTDKLRNLLSKDPNVINYSSYVREMSEIYSGLATGSLPKQSVLFYAPQGSMKDEFVFTSMQLALSKGFKVAPYLDTKEYDRVYCGEFDKNRYKFDEDFDFVLEDFIYADICFMKISVAGLKSLKRDLFVLKQLVDQRARKGKPTIITSNFPLYYLFKSESSYDRFILKEKIPYEYGRPLYAELQTNYGRKFKVPTTNINQ